jgi:integrase
LLKSGGKDNRPLSARTVGHAHRVLHRALARAAAAEIVARNVASAISPPKVEAEEIEILSAEQMADILAKLNGHSVSPIVALALGTGMRRGELLGLQWSDIDLEGASLRVERSIEETKAGLRFKPPKTKYGRRTISLPQSSVEALKAQRRSQLETRLALGLGRPEGSALVFSTVEGSPLSPDNLSRDWRRVVKAFKLPAVTFHALRHSHASALIASGLDILSISRRLGHGSPMITLTVYGHLFDNTDTKAAAAIEAALKKR